MWRQASFKTVEMTVKTDGLNSYPKFLYNVTAYNFNLLAKNIRQTSVWSRKYEIVAYFILAKHGRDFFLYYLYILDSIQSVRKFSCPPASLSHEVISIRRFLNAHHFYWSRMWVVPGGNPSHYQKSLLLIKHM